MNVYKSKPGETLSDAVRNAIATAKSVGVKAQLSYDGILVEVTGQSDVESICAQWRSLFKERLRERVADVESICEQYTEFGDRLLEPVTKSVTRDEAKAAFETIIDGFLTTSDRDKLCHIVMQFITETPDAKVWAEIETLLDELKEVTGLSWNVDGMHKGKWGICTFDSPNGECVRETMHCLTLPKLRDELAARLRAMTKPQPTIEDEQAARKEAEVEMGKWEAISRKLSCDNLAAEEKLAAAEERVAGLEKELALSHETVSATACTAMDSLEELRAAQARIAELETPVVLRQYKTDCNMIYQVSNTLGVDGTFNVWWSSSNLTNCGRSVEHGISDSFPTEREAQEALDKYAKGHDLEEVKP